MKDRYFSTLKLLVDLSSEVTAQIVCTLKGSGPSDCLKKKLKQRPIVRFQTIVFFYDYEGN